MSLIRLLIVDDEERFLITTKSLLDKRGVITAVATNGADAMNILERENIDVVILDIKMPGMSGIYALRKIKEKYPFIEIIILSGHGSPDSAVEALNMGAFAFLMKPCDIQTLLSKVQEAWAKKTLQERTT